MSTPEPGDAGSGKAPGGTGKSNGKEGRRRARFRRRLSLPGLGSVGRPRLRRAGRERAKRPRIPRPKLPGDLGFRLRTRLRAIRYWLREKGQVAGRWLRDAGKAIAFWWSKRSRATRIQIFTVAGIVALYLIVKFAAVPGVPCEVSAAKECAPSNDTIAFVPRDSVLYAHLTVNSDSHQWDLADDLRKELPSLATLLRSATTSLSTSAARPIDASQDILPWAKDDIALLGVPGPQKTTPEAFIVGIGDASKAGEFLATLEPAGKSKQAEAGGAPLTVYAGGFATARLDDQFVFGNVTAVRAALEAKTGDLPRLDGSDQDAAREQLPDVRLAEVYLSQAGVLRMLAGRQGGASQLDTFVDYGASTGMAVGLRVRDDGVRVNVVSDLDPKLEQRSPTVFADLPRFDPSLADEAGPRALGYVGVGDIGPALNQALSSAGAGAQGLAGSLRALAQRLQQEAGVDPLADLLPALNGQAALVAEPTDAVPFASLIVDGVDEKKAGEALASLQGPILRSLAAGAPQVPKFQSQDVDGVTVHSIQLSPSVNLSYGLFDGKLVISTQPQGIAQVRSGGDNLAGTGAYENATDRLPDEVSALVFLNLDEVLGLAQQAGLAEDPLYASLSEDISHIQSLGVAVRGSDEELDTELFLAIPD